jgi:hypothetical protein
MQKENITAGKHKDPEWEQIHTLIENLNYGDAKLLLITKLKSNPDDIEVLDTLSEVLFNLDEIEDAKQVRYQ